MANNYPEPVQDPTRKPNKSQARALKERIIVKLQNTTDKDF